MNENTNLAAEITTKILCAAYQGHKGPVFGPNGIRGAAKSAGDAFATLYSAVQKALTPPTA